MDSDSVFRLLVERNQNNMFGQFRGRLVIVNRERLELLDTGLLARLLGGLDLGLSAAKLTHTANQILERDSFDPLPNLEGAPPVK